MEATTLHRFDVADPIDLSQFQAGLDGSVLFPGHPDFDTTREVHNAAIDRRPALIVQPANAADVARTVVLARESGLELAIRGGGHSFAGHSSTEGGILLDMRSMKGLHIDPETRMVWAQPGLTAGEVTNALAAHGLAVPFGDTASVGIAGLTLGGGIGWLARKHGLAIDALQSVELVTADGRQVTASETEHPDLFWAVRGGGGNFGIVTRFQYKAVEVGMILGGALFLPATREVLQSLGPIASSAPRELTTITFFMASAPPAPFVPEPIQGKPVVVVMFVYDGDAESGQAALAPFRQVATPLVDMAMPMPYPGIYKLAEAGEQRSLGAHGSTFLAAFDDTAVDIVLEEMAAASSPAAMTQIRILGGAMADVPADATAFAHRDAPVLVTVITPFFDPTEAETHETWTAAFTARLSEASIGVYSNFLGDEGEARVHDAYPAATFDRLARIKRKYDPTNLFRRNQNIRPASLVG